MAIITFRGEKDLGELADKLFTRLTPRQREKVEGELLKANPQLQEMSALRSGSVLKVPPLPELQAKAKRASDGPDDQLAALLSSELANFGKYLTPRFSASQEALLKTDELLASAEFNRAIGKDKVLRDLAKSIGAENTARKQELEKRQQAVVNALKQMRTDL